MCLFATLILNYQLNMTVKFDNFLMDLKALLDKHDLSFGFTYDGLTVINKDTELDKNFDTLFEDKTKE